MECDSPDDCEPPGIVINMPMPKAFVSVSAYASSESCSDTDSGRSLQKQKEVCCPLCGACFTQEQNLRSHIRRKHVGSENVVCNICDKVLSSKSALKRHLLVHSDKTPFACDLCNSAYRQKFELERHLDACHSDRELADRPKPYHCNVCCRQFMFHSSLTAHSRSHLRHLACDQCNRCFMSATDLRRHRLAIHQPPEERPYICHFCSERFSRKHQLHQHLNTHARSGKVTCPVCGIACNGTLAEHYVSAHASIGEDTELRRSFIRGVDQLVPNHEAPDLSLLDALLLSPDLVC